MTFKLLNASLIIDFTMKVGENPSDLMKRSQKQNIPVDYFQFYKSVSSVYSSKIEGEDIDFDSYFKHKFMNIEFKADYTKKADDLFSAYTFIENVQITADNVKKAHAILSSNLLPDKYQGQIRTNPMYVLNDKDQIEYVAASPYIVSKEFEKLFNEIEKLRDIELNSFEVFYYAALIHLVFVKIHPFQDGNGRTARLLEKWFLIEKFGMRANDIELEKNYWEHRSEYYQNIKKLGIEYDFLDYSQSLDFLLMTIESVKNKAGS